MEGWLIAVIVVGSIILCCTMCCVCVCCGDMTKRKVIQPKVNACSIVADTAKGQIEYSITGDAPYVLFVHGSPGGHDGYAKLAEALEWPKNGFGVIAPSRPGYGRTPLSSGMTYPDQADLFAALLDTLKIDKVVLFAMSGGGPAVLSFAAQHPSRTNCCIIESACTGSLPHESARCLLSTCFGNAFLSPSLFMQLQGDPTDRKNIKDMIADQTTKTGQDLEQYVDGIMADPYRKDLMNNMARQLETIGSYSSNKQGLVNDIRNQAAAIPFEKITVPCHITHGDADKTIDYAAATKRATEGIKNAELLIVEGGSHSIFFDPKGRETMKQ